jgi:UDPglucose 6-dehydrogenase
VHDPQAGASARRAQPQLTVVDTVEAACAGADLVLVLTEWPQYTSLDPAAAKSLVAHARVLDGRNCLDADAWRAAGWHYRALGRRDVAPEPEGQTAV